MDADVLPPKLLTVLHTAAEKVRGHDFIHVFSHYDADGVAAASVLAVMLERLGKEYQVSTLPVLNDTTFEAVESSSADCILMSDMGASYIPRLEGLGRDVVVLDHHRTDYDSDRIVFMIFTVGYDHYGTADFLLSRKQSHRHPYGRAYCRTLYRNHARID